MHHTYVCSLCGSMFGRTKVAFTRYFASDLASFEEAKLNLLQNHEHLQAEKSLTGCDVAQE